MKSYVTAMLQIQDQLKIFHFQTKSYARHKAFGKVYDEFSELVDAFVEVSMGKHGRFVLDRDEGIEIVNISDEAINRFVEETISFLIGLSGQLDPKTDTDLLNIRDDMLGEFNRLKYLLTLS
jgi:hypothetical protein